MAAGSNFGAPSPASFMIKVEAPWPKTHAFYISELARKGVKPAELLQVDLGGKSGWAVISVSDEEVRDRILSSGLQIRGRNATVVVGSSEVISVHVFGCHCAMSDNDLSDVLSEFGIVHGPPNHGTASFEQFIVETGTRYVQMSIRKSVPSSLRVGGTTVRLWHRGQQRTCFKCNLPGHEAKECPELDEQADKSSRSTPAATPNTAENPKLTKTNTPDKEETKDNEEQNEQNDSADGEDNEGGNGSTNEARCSTPSGNWADDSNEVSLKRNRHSRSPTTDDDGYIEVRKKGRRVPPGKESSPTGIHSV